MFKTTIRGNETKYAPEFESKDIFQYSKFNHLENLLIDNTLGFSSLYDFNDPFETAYNLTYYFKSLIDRNIYLNELNGKNGSKTELVDKIKDIIKNELSKISITCFSKTPYEPLMWAHYSEKHTGICYCFDKSSIFDREKFHYKDLQYSSELPTINFYELKTTLEILKHQIENIIFTKSTNWIYEKELRFYIESTEKTFKFNPKSLNAVIIGYRVTDHSKIKKLVDNFNLINKTDVIILYAKPGITDYKMNISNNKPSNGSAMGIPFYNYNEKPII